MALKIDRVGNALNMHLNRKPHALMTPEGVPLMTSVANLKERFSALLIDLGIMLTACILLVVFFIGLALEGGGSLTSLTLAQFSTFVIRVLYFTHFELAWQGQTPGKRLCGLRVISHTGGELAPAAIVARNLTREVEIFQPLTFILLYDFYSMESVILLYWTVGIALIPFCNNERRRAGDFIANTMVIHMPKERLLPDLADNIAHNAVSDAAGVASAMHEPHDPRPSPVPGQPAAPQQYPVPRAFSVLSQDASAPLPPKHSHTGSLSGKTSSTGGGSSSLVNGSTSSPLKSTLAEPVYTFSPAQLAVYGVFELQVLEEFLRRPDNAQNTLNLEKICRKICRKIQWTEPVPAHQVRRFLTDFYAAERAELERGQLFGKVKEDKFSGQPTQKTS